MTRDELLQDVAYARSLAEEGRQAPLIGGPWLVMFGIITPLAYAAQYAALTGAMPRNYIGYIWLAFGAAALVGALLLRGRMRAMPGNSSVSNRADRAVWQGVAWAIIFVVVGAIARGINFGDYAATNAIMAVGFGLYGVALYSTASISGHMWMRIFAWLSWSVSATLWLFFGENWSYLVAAAGGVLVLLVPGLIMMRHEPNAIV